jgi:hypothetical protein
MFAGFGSRFSILPTPVAAVVVVSGGGSPRGQAGVPAPDDDAAHAKTIAIEAPDPSGDDGLRLQKAIDALAIGGGVIRMAPGVYRLRIRDGIRAIAPRRNVRIVGAGADQTILRVVSGSARYMSVFYPERTGDDLSGFALRDLTIDQDGEVNRSAGVEAPENVRAVVTVFNGSSVRIEGCRFTGLAGRNTLIINGPRVSDVWITNNHFDKVGTLNGPHYDHSTVYSHATRVHITGNTFAGRASATDVFGATTAIETHGSEHVITGNIIDGYIQGMNVTGVAERSTNIIVSGNSISGTAVGIQLWSYFYGSNRSRPALSNLIVSGNTIVVDRDRWLHVAGSALVGSGISLNPNGDAALEQVQIDGNAITFKPTSHAGAGDDQSGGIELWAANPNVRMRGLSITRNQVDGAYGAGIRISVSAESVVVSENEITNPGRSTGKFADGFRSAILVSHVQNSLMIRGNQFIDNQPAATMKYGIHDATMPGSSGLQAVDNQLQTAAPSLPIFWSAASNGAFLLRLSVQTVDVVPGAPVQAGSTITETVTGRVRTQIDAPFGTSWRSQAYGSEPPRTGAWRTGDIVYNTSPVPGGSVGWVCTVSGTPGNFRPFGRIVP